MPTTEEIRKIKLILEKIDAIYKIYASAGGVEYVSPMLSSCYFDAYSDNQQVGY